MAGDVIDNEFVDNGGVDVIAEVETSKTMEVSFNGELMDAVMQFIEEEFPELTIIEVVVNFHMFNKMVQEKYNIEIGE